MKCFIPHHPKCFFPASEKSIDLENVVSDSQPMAHVTGASRHRFRSKMKMSLSRYLRKYVYQVDSTTTIRSVSQADLFIMVWYGRSHKNYISPIFSISNIHYDEPRHYRYSCRLSRCLLPFRLHWCFLHCAWHGGKQPQRVDC